MYSIHRKFLLEPCTCPLGLGCWMTLSLLRAGYGITPAEMTLHCDDDQYLGEINQSHSVTN